MDRHPHAVEASDKGSISKARAAAIYPSETLPLGCLWPAPKAWSEELRKKLTRNMTRKEWCEWVSPEIPYIVQCSGLPIPPDK